MPTAPRARTTKLIASSTVAAGLALSAGVACNENKQPPAAQAVETQRQQQPLARLPSNAPQAAPPPESPAAPPQSASPAPAQATAIAPGPAPSTSVPPAAEPQGSRAGVPAAPTVDVPNIPADARWTIYCFAVKGPAHAEGARQAKAGLVAKTGRPDWYVIHGSDESKIYYGFYKAIDARDRKDAADGQRATDDLKLVKELRDLNGKQPFAQSVFVSLDSPDPTSPAEWNLFNVDRALHPKDPKRAYWSLQIGAVRADPLRKEKAVDAVRELRAAGVEAYYYHGESVSSVCVGRWPADAIKAQNRTDDRKDVAHSTVDTNLVVSAVPLETLRPQGDLKAKPIDGKQAATVAPKLEVLDPRLREAMERFPHCAVNGEVGVQLPDGTVRYNPSFLVEVPRAKGNGLYDSDPPADRQPTAGQPTLRRGGLVGSGSAVPRDRVLGSTGGYYPPANGQ